jgi:hypothetical protein
LVVLFFHFDFSQVVYPLSGYALKLDNSTVSLIPESANMRMFTVVIQNLHSIKDTLRKDFPTVVQSGDFMAKATRDPVCNHMTIKLAIQQRNVYNEKDYVYVDPISFLQQPFPSPEWRHLCNEYSYEQRGHVVQEGDFSNQPSRKKTNVRRQGSAINIDNLVKHKSWGVLNHISLSTESNDTDAQHTMLPELEEYLRYVILV